MKLYSWWVDKFLQCNLAQSSFVDLYAQIRARLQLTLSQLPADHKYSVRAGFNSHKIM